MRFAAVSIDILANEGEHFAVHCSTVSEGKKVKYE